MSGSAQPPAVPSSDEAASSQPTVSAQEHADTQRSLQQASVALEVASNRIRQVRRSLIQLSESLPNPDDLFRFNRTYNDIRPGHEALLLSGDGSNRSNNLPRRRVRNAPTFRDATSATEPASAIGDSQGVQNDIQAVTNLSDPLIPLPVDYRLTSETSQDMYFDPNSAATTRGLRVAAREVDLQEIAADLPSLSRHHRDDSALDPRVITPVATPRPESEDDRARQEQLYQMMRIRDSQFRDIWRSINGPLPVPSATTSRLSESRRWRRPPPSSPFTADAQRYAMLPSEMINPPLPLPSQSTGSPAGLRTVSRAQALALPPRALPDEPAQAGLVGGSVEQHRLLQDIILADYPRSNFSLDWSDDDFIPWLPAQREASAQISNDNAEFTTRRDQLHEQYIGTIRQNIDSLRQHIDSIRINRTTNTDISPPERSAPRRGWARLDADGNEIPPNEEEELERLRTDYRLRTMQRARQHIAAAQSGQPEPSTRGWSYGSIVDATLTVQETGRQRPLRIHTPVGIDVMPLYVDPLPMPLASMVTAPDTPKEEDIYIDIVFPRHACLAGR